MPTPVSRTSITTQSPLGIRRFEPASARRARMVSTPPPGMASRALTARLSRAFSSWAGSTWTHIGSPAASVSICTVSPTAWRISGRKSSIRPSMSTETGLSCWRREKARSWRVRLRPRSAACRTAFSCRCCRGSFSSLRASMSMLPRITVSRLLKSCATPPVSWPTASIFWAWASWRSAFIFSVLTRAFSSMSCWRCAACRSISTCFRCRSTSTCTFERRMKGSTGLNTTSTAPAE